MSDDPAQIAAAAAEKVAKERKQTIHDKLDGARAQVKALSSEKNDLANRVVELEKQLALASEASDKAKAKAENELSAKDDLISSLKSEISGIGDAPAAVEAERVRADTAEALLVTSREKSDAVEAVLREDLKALQVKVFTFREAVKGL